MRVEQCFSCLPHVGSASLLVNLYMMELLPGLLRVPDINHLIAVAYVHPLNLFADVVSEELLDTLERWAVLARKFLRGNRCAFSQILLRHDLIDQSQPFLLFSRIHCASVSDYMPKAGLPEGAIWGMLYASDQSSVDETTLLMGRKSECISTIPVPRSCCAAAHAL